MRYMNKPLPQAPYNGHAPIDTSHKSGSPQTRRPLVEDDESECENEMVHPLSRRRDKNPTKRTGDFSEMRDKNPARRSADFSDLPLRSIRTYKSTLKVATSHYTGETLKLYTPSIRNREPRVQE